MTPRDRGPGPRRATVAGWMLLIAALLLILAFGSVSERSMFSDAVFDAGHTPLFGLVALATLGILRARAPEAPTAAMRWQAFFLTVVLGAVTEVLQVFQSNREASLSDFLRDAAGAAAFLLLSGLCGRQSATGRLPLLGRGRALALPVGALLLVACAAQLGMTTAAYVARDRAIPTLVALDGSWWERRFVRLENSTLTPHAKARQIPAGVVEPLAGLALEPALYPGVTVEEPFPDWRGYRRLVFTVVSDLGTPLRLTIRVHDAAHDQRYEDRFNLTLSVAHGVNRFAIPLEDIKRAPDRREMDMRRIRGIVLFAYQLKEPTRVYISALRLE
jgi:hypothetical protein